MKVLAWSAAFALSLAAFVPVLSAASNSATVVLNGKTRVLKTGAKPSLREGDKVTVVVGEVTFLLPGGGKVTASGTGAGFSVARTADGFVVTAAGGSVSVSDPGGSSTALAPNASFSVPRNAQNNAGGAPSAN